MIILRGARPCHLHLDVQRTLRSFKDNITNLGDVRNRFSFVEKINVS